MKISLCFFILFFSSNIKSLLNEDIIALKRSLIIFADGVSKELINER